VARVTFTQNLERHVDCPVCEVDGHTVKEALNAVFARYPRLRGYVLDDQGAVRKHMAVFMDGAQIRDRAAQSDPITDSTELYVFQALSGG
jgi:sulfur-carrier protein